MSQQNPELPKQTGPNPASRVMLEYDVEAGEQILTVQLPFVMGVMTDLSGMPITPLLDVAQRQFLEFDISNFDSRMQVIKPHLAFQVPNVLTFEGELDIDLVFTSMVDFSPTAIAQRVGSLQQLLKDRTTLAQFPAGVASTEQMMSAVAHPVAVQAVKSSASTAAILAEIDQRLSAQIHLILHHPEFQKLESAWRGLHFLVANSSTDHLLKIRVMNISKKELLRSLRHFMGSTREQGPIFKCILAGLSEAQGEPFGCIIGDYHFDHSPPDVVLLTEIGMIATEAHCPFISGASPSLLQMQSWEELRGTAELSHVFAGDEYRGWRLLRDHWESAVYLGLTLPRFLARQVYGERTNPVKEFKFEEKNNGDTLVWANSAYVMGVNINRAFSQSGWFGALGSPLGGLIDNLPTHDFPNADGGTVRRSTEVALHDKHELPLQRAGLSPLFAGQNSSRAFFSRPQSLCKAPTYLDVDEDVDFLVWLHTQLHHRLACCRFVHYLHCVARSRIGGFFQAADFENGFNELINRYVVSDDNEENSSASRPLNYASAAVSEVNHDQNSCRVQLLLRPRYLFPDQCKSTRLFFTVNFGHKRD